MCGNGTEQWTNGAPGVWDRLLDVKEVAAGASGLEKLSLPMQSEATT